MFICSQNPGFQFYGCSGIRILNVINVRKPILHIIEVKKLQLSILYNFRSFDFQLYSPGKLPNLYVPKQSIASWVAFRSFSF